MKTKFTILAGIFTFLSLAFVSASAQTLEPAVKIIPTSENGIYKLIFAYDSDQTVQVKFFNNKEGVLKLDRIQPEKFENGFSKKYDVSNIDSKDFWVEVSSSKLSVRYKMTKGSKAYEPVLESTTFVNTLTASNN